MPVTKEKLFSPAPRQRRNRSTQRTNGKSLNDAQLTALLQAYQAMGKMLETFVGRERLYRPQFLKGLENALQDVAMGRTQEVKTFDDFAR
jgi:recombinational DNA repair protein (RecF pathway)